MIGIVSEQLNLFRLNTAALLLRVFRLDDFDGPSKTIVAKARAAELAALMPPCPYDAIPKISSTVEILKLRKKELVRLVGKTERTLKQLDCQIKKQKKLKENDAKRALEKIKSKGKPKALAF